VIVGVVLAGIVIAVIIFALRRATTMSNELSEQARVKFEAIKPKPQEEMSKETQLPLQTRPIDPQATDHMALKAELQENSGKLQQQIHEILELKEREDEVAKEIEIFKTEIFMLRDQLSSEGKELEKLSLLLGQQVIGLQNLTRDIETQENKFNEALKAVWRTIRRELTERIPQPITPGIAAPPSSEARDRSGRSRFFNDMLGRRACPFCGHHIRTEDRYCYACGRPIEGPASHS